MSLQSELISYIERVNYNDLPPKAIEASKKSILDTIAAILAGSTDDYIPELVDLAQQWAGRQECTIPVYGIKVPAHIAALVNCTMARARDLDDVHRKGGGHLSANIVPTAFVASEYSKLFKGRKIDGRNFIVAVAMGADVLCRISMAATDPNIPRTWVSETWAPMAVAALAAKLWGFDKDKIRNALGIAYARLSGNSQVYEEGAYTARFQNGFAGEGGILSAILADRGVKGPEEIFEGKAGLFSLYFRGEYSRDQFLHEIGKRFEGENVSLKLYPVAAGIIPAIHGCIEILRRFAIKPESVNAVKIVTSKFLLQSLGSEKKRMPRSIPEAQFSLYYGPAVALLKGRVWLEDFTEEGIRRKDVLEMCKRITVVADIEKETMKVLLPPTGVEVETKDGKRYSMEVKVAPGQPENPLSWADITQKLKDCLAWSARPFTLPRMEEMSEKVRNLDELDDATDLLAYLI